MRHVSTWSGLGSCLLAALAISCNVASDVNGTTPVSPSNWSGAVRIDSTNTAANAAACAVAMDASGDFFPAWQQTDGNGLVTLWGNPYEVGTAALLGEGGLTPGLSGASGAPSVAVGGNLVFQYAWVQSGGASDSEIYANRWSVTAGMDAPVRVNTGYGLSPALAVNANGDACLAWAEQGATAWTIMAAYRPVDAAAWSAPTAISTGLVNAASPRIALDDSDDIVAVWAEQPNAEVAAFTLQTATYTVAGGWSAPASPQVGALADPAYALAMTDAGAQIAWSDSNDGASWQVRTARWTKAAGWSAVSLLSASQDLSHEPALGMDAGGNTVAVWVVGSTALNTASYTSGGGWTAAVPLFPAVANGLDSPRLSINAGGTGALAWRQSDGATMRIASALYTAASGWADPAYIQVASGGDAQAPCLQTGAGAEVVVVWNQLGADSLEHVYANLHP